jgi:hypothetical protein
MKSDTIKTHGGNRAGSGRPKNPDSIRSKLAKAVALGATHSRTAYQVWSSNFIMEHGHPFLGMLMIVWDKNTRALNSEGAHKGIISRHQAVTIAGLHEDVQLDFLVEPLHTFVQQYKDDKGAVGDRAREIQLWLERTFDSVRLQT